MKPLKKPRSYSDFTLQHLRELLGINNHRHALNLLQQPIEPTDWLKITLEKNKAAPINSEKARSELLITPILIELLTRNPQKFNYFSGNTFDVEPLQALKGRCDFLLTKQLSLDITAPIITVFEAKDDNIDNWYGQCGAEMYAARLFNERHNEPYRIIHGAVTDGYQWIFLRLEESMLWVDTERYYLHDLSGLLGVLQNVIDFYNATSS